MKQTPFAVILGGTLPTNAILCSLLHVHTGTVADINAQIAEVNTNFALYGFGSTPNLPLLPAIPTPGASAPNGIGYFQSEAPGGTGPNYGPTSSFLLIDAFTDAGYSTPSTALDTLLTDVNLTALINANANLRAVITAQPPNRTVTNPTGTTFTVTATGNGLTYQWQVQALGTGAWVNLADTGIYSGSATSILTLASTVVGLSTNKYRVMVDTLGAGPVASTAGTLTVN